MGYLFLWFLWQAAPVPDDWEAVHRALNQALAQVSLPLPETLSLAPQVAGEPYQWVVEPLLHRFLQQEMHRVLAQGAPVLEFRPLEIRLEKHRVGWWGTHVKRRVRLRLWLALRDQTRSLYLWQEKVAGEYQDQYPVALEATTRVEGLSPPLKEHPHLWRDLLATLAVSGLVFLLYSGGHGP